MQDSGRTLIFVGVAAVALFLGWLGSRSTAITPADQGIVGQGQPFYPEFDDPTGPDQIRVVTVDEARAEVKTFEVKRTGNKWTIPSHYDFEVDGEERLKNTANSAIGIMREELRSTSKNDHQDLGVLDPLGSNQKELKGYGRRITLSKAGEAVMDLIVGKSVEGRPSHYFVRVPSEVATFVAKVELDLSTNFKDWVKTDLLEFDRDDMRKIEIDNSRVNLEKGALEQGDVVELTRAKSADPWKLTGLDESKEELDTTKVNDLVNTLDDQKLIGVRPKSAVMKRALKGEGSAELNLQEAQQLVDKGFYFVQGRGLIGAEGELMMATAKGTVYVLQFGNNFVGDEFDIEVGLDKKPAGKSADAKDAKTDEKKDADKKPGDPEKKDAEKKDAGTDDADKKDGDIKDDAGKKAGRYLFVRAIFREEALEGKPVEPTPPVTPTETPKSDETKTDETKTDETKTESAKPDEKKADEPKPEAPKADEKQPDEPKPEAAKPDEKKSDEKKSDEPKPNETQSSPGTGAQDPKPDPAKPAEDKPADGKRDQKPAEDKPTEKPADAKPEEKPADKPADAKSGDKPTDKPEDKPADAKPADKPADSPPGDAKPADKPAKSAADLQKEYEQAKKKYEEDLIVWKKKVTEAKEATEKLNRRFADWYYVISAEDFNKLRLARKDLVKAKTPAADATKTDPTKPQVAPPPPLPETEPEDKPAEDKKPEGAKPDDKKSDESKADAKKPEEKPAAAPKPDEKKPSEAPKDKPNDSKPEPEKTPN